MLTVEIEHVDAATLEKLEQQGVHCQPKASTIRIIQVWPIILIEAYILHKPYCVVYVMLGSNVGYLLVNSHTIHDISMVLRDCSLFAISTSCNLTCLQLTI